MPRQVSRPRPEYEPDEVDYLALFVCGAVSGGIAALGTPGAVVGLAVFVFGVPLVFSIWFGWRERSMHAAFDGGKHAAMAMFGLTFLFRELWHLVGWAWTWILAWSVA
jgi:hypothetical protein